MALLDTQPNGPEAAADSRFFISPENRPSPLVLALIDNLPQLAADSTGAKTALNEMTDEQYKEYKRLLGEYSSKGGNDEAAAVVGRVQGLMEQANRYSDAVAAIQGAGQSLASHLRTSLDPVFRDINGNFYWLGRDGAGKTQLCGMRETESGQDLVYFGTVAFPEREAGRGREAALADYITLITDVSATAGDTEQ